MTQYDAGPGDWSDRPWEDPEKKPQPHAKRRRVSLPPWALLAAFIAIVIILCLSLVLVIRAIRNKSGQATPTAMTTAVQTVSPATWTPTVSLGAPTATVVLPIEGTVEPTPITEIGPGATVVVKGTGGAGLNVRQQPSTYAKIVASAKEGSELLVLEGPSEADGYTWWKVRTSDGKEGWGAGKWLVLKTEQ